MSSAKVVFYQSIGFLVIIVLSWINELLGLRTLILGEHPYISDFRESTLEMLFILAVWLIVVRSTRRLLGEVRHLEGFLRVCAWCRRIGDGSRWLRLEEYFDENFHRPTSHSICRECLDKQSRGSGINDGGTVPVQTIASPAGQRDRPRNE